jgi:hypothetical protein
MSTIFEEKNRKDEQTVLEKATFNVKKYNFFFITILKITDMEHFLVKNLSYSISVFFSLYNQK